MSNDTPSSSPLTSAHAGRPHASLTIVVYLDNGDITLNGPLEDPTVVYELLHRAALAYHLSRSSGLKPEPSRILSPFPSKLA